MKPYRPGWPLRDASGRPFHERHSESRADPSQRTRQYLRANTGGMKS